MIGEPTRNVLRIAALIEHPDIAPGLVGAGPLDVTALANDPRVICFVGAGGIFVFAHRGAREYIAHVGLIRRARGPYGVSLGREAFGWLFGTVGAARCVAEAPAALPQVAVFAKALGFKRARLCPVHPNRASCQGVRIVVDLTQIYQALQNGGSLGGSLMAAFAHPAAPSQVGQAGIPEQVFSNALAQPTVGQAAMPQAQMQAMTPYQQGMALAQRQTGGPAGGAPSAGIDQSMLQGMGGSPQGQKTSPFGQILKMFSGGA